MIITQAAVLDWLPPWIAQDFDCPNGPHEYLPRVTAHGNSYQWCRHCNRMRRTSFLDTHPHLRLVDEWLRA